MRDEWMSGCVDREGWLVGWYQCSELICGLVVHLIYREGGKA